MTIQPQMELTVVHRYPWYQFKPKQENDGAGVGISLTKKIAHDSKIINSN